LDACMIIYIEDWVYMYCAKTFKNHLGLYCFCLKIRITHQIYNQVSANKIIMKKIIHGRIVPVLLTVGWASFILALL
jgi:hypothetical protein